MSMADQYADLTKDPGGMRQQMSGAGNTIGNALRANSQAMTDAGVGPLAPYSEKNPGPYNFMGPAMYGGESADKIAKEKAAMFPGMGGMFGGGGMGMMGGGMGYIPKPEDLQRQIDYMDTMDMVKRRHQQNAAEAFQQNTMQYPAYANMFGTMLNGIFGGNRQQFPTSFSTNYGAIGGMTQPPAKQESPRQSPGRIHESPATVVTQPSISPVLTCNSITTRPYRKAGLVAISRTKSKPCEPLKHPLLLKRHSTHLCTSVRE